MIKDASAEQKKLVSIIIKADVHGSKEAIEQSLKKMNSDLVEIKIIHTGVGEVNESDVTLATASDALIFGFNVKANVQAKNLAKREKVNLRYFSIIYEVIDEANKIIEGMFTPDSVESLIGKGIIKKVFNMSDSSKVAGSSIEDGKVTSKAFVENYKRSETNCRSANSKSEKRKKSSKRSFIWIGMWNYISKIQ